MSGNVFFNPTPSHSQWFHYHSHSHSEGQPGFIPIPFQVPSVIPFPHRCQSHTTILSHLLLFFMDIMKAIISKLTTIGSLLVSKTTENHIKIQNVYTVPRLSNTGLSKVYVLRRVIRFLLQEIGKCSVFIPLYSHQAIPMLFPMGPTEISISSLVLNTESWPLLNCPRPSARQHPSYGDCLEVKREYYQNSSVLDCVTQCSQSAAHLCEQFLQVK